MAGRSWTLPTFAYEATSKQGGTTRGVIEAPSRSLAVERILALGQTPTRITEKSATAGVDGFKLPSTGSFVPQWNVANDRLAIMRELSLLLRAGLSVERALVAMQGLAKTNRVKSVLAHLLEGLRGGESLSGAMARAGVLFPESMRKLIAAGESSGRLPEVAARLADAQARNKELTDRVVSALIYPVLLVIVMLAVLVMIFTVVLPRLEPLFSQAQGALPWPTAILVALGHFLDAFGLWIAIALIAVLVYVFYALRQPATQFAIDRFMTTSRFTLDLPRRYQAAQFCRNLGMLIDGGMTLNRALEAAEPAMTNRYMRSIMPKLIDEVRQGRTLRSAIDSAGVFPRLTAEFAAIGEETGRLGPMMNEAAQVLDRDVQTQLDRLSAMLLPAVTIVLGGIVAAIMAGVVTGILAANDLAL
jgi:general secretion pathway protein F